MCNRKRKEIEGVDVVLRPSALKSGIGMLVAIGEFRSVAGSAAGPRIHDVVAVVMKVSAGGWIVSGRPSICHMAHKRSMLQ